VRRRRRPTITVYTRAGCHLCERAEAEVARLARGRAHVDLVDIDADPALRERYTVRVPVVAVDGREVAELEVDPAALRAVLRQRWAT
jgi:glutaredoxin